MPARCHAERTMFELDSLCAMIGLQSGLTGLFAEQIVECRLDNRRIEANPLQVFEAFDEGEQVRRPKLLVAPLSRPPIGKEVRVMCRIANFKQPQVLFSIADLPAHTLGNRNHFIDQAIVYRAGIDCDRCDNDGRAFAFATVIVVLAIAFVAEPLDQLQGNHARRFLIERNMHRHRLGICLLQRQTRRLI